MPMNNYDLTDDITAMIAAHIVKRQMDMYSRDSDEKDLYTCGYNDCLDEISKIISNHLS